MAGWSSTLSRKPELIKKVLWAEEVTSVHQGPGRAQGEPRSAPPYGPSASVASLQGPIQTPLGVLVCPMQGPIVGPYAPVAMLGPLQGPVLEPYAHKGPFGNHLLLIFIVLLLELWILPLLSPPGTSVRCAHSQYSVCLMYSLLGCDMCSF